MTLGKAPVVRPPIPNPYANDLGHAAQNSYLNCYAAANRRHAATSLTSLTLLANESARQFTAHRISDGMMNAYQAPIASRPRTSVVRRFGFGGKVRP